MAQEKAHGNTLRFAASEMSVLWHTRCGHALAEALRAYIDDAGIVEDHEG
jgi:hypothetical protein